MDAGPTVEMVYQGICTLFHNGNPKEKEKANVWLQEFQNSIYSWSIADELLQQKIDLHSCYFAAQTMRNKIQNSFNELPPGSHESLRDSILAHIGRITPGTEAIVMTQLCLAIADLALLMVNWKTPIEDMIEMFSGQQQSLWPLLEVLTVLPEELDSRNLCLGENRREDIIKQMERASPKVLDFLWLCLSQASGNDELIHNSTLRCFGAWISAHGIPLRILNENAIVQHIFTLLSTTSTSSKIHDTSSECLCLLLNWIEANTNIDPMFKMRIFNSVCALEQGYHASVAHEDIEKTMSYCRVFTLLCETFLEHMMSDDDTVHYSFTGMDLVLMCVGHFDYEVAEITFILWYRISEDLFQRNNDKLTARFAPHIERLLGALYRHSQLDGDNEGLIDESDNFSDFRRKVSDLIRDVAFIVGSGACFKQMFLTLQAPGATWESTESALFIMQNVAKNILPEENEIIPKVVEAILNLPQNTHIAVRYTSILLLGELCDWIDHNSEPLQAVLNFLLYSLQQQSGVAAAAAIALTAICSACRQKMLYHISGLIEIARSLDSFQIQNDLAIGLLKGISLIVSRLPLDQVETTMREIVSFQLQPLVQLVEDRTTATATVKKGDRTDPSYWIDRLCAIVRHVNPDLTDDDIHPTLKILTDAWPLISSVMDKYQMDVRIMERTCRLIRYALRMVHKQASILGEPLAKQMICLYTLHRHSCFLYLGSVLVDEFARSEECIPGLLEMLKAFIEPTFSILQVENGFKDNPDTVDDFFRLCSRFIEGCPVAFLKSTLVTPIFQCALLACGLEHREANSSVMKFFCNLLKWGRWSNYRHAESCALVKDIAVQNGEALVLNLIQSSVYCLHSYMLPDVAEVLIELSTVVGREQMKVFLKTSLDTLPKKNKGGYVTATQQQLDDFSNTVLRNESPKSVTMALKTFTRLYR